MYAAVLHGKNDLRLETVAAAQPEAEEVVVRVTCGGICGSDLSYFHKGRVGDFALSEPMTLGHEIAGIISRVGDGVETVRVGDRVAVNPSRPCLTCDYCRSGRSNLCRDMFFLGSAARFPHVQGGFTEELVVRADQCFVLADKISLLVASCAEPLSVALHAASQADGLAGKRVIVTGVGPIGQLCVAVARAYGAREIVATDFSEWALSKATTIGADRGINVSDGAEALAEYTAGKGYFDVAFEASGSPAALTGLFRVVRPGGKIIQLGMLPPDGVNVPMNLLQAREIELIGSFRFHEEFGLAVDMLTSGRIDVTPILSEQFPAAKAIQAFNMAGDRSRALKVHLIFD